MLDAIREERPVGEAGERVVEGLVAKLLLGLAACRDVEQVSLEHLLAAVGVGDDPRLVVHPDDATVPRDAGGSRGAAARRWRASLRVRRAPARGRRDAGRRRRASGRRPTPPPSSRAWARSAGSCRCWSSPRRRGRCRRRAAAARRACGSGSRPGANGISASLALGDVDRESLSEPALRRPIHEHRLVLHPDETAVGSVHPVLESAGLAARIGDAFAARTRARSSAWIERS